MFRAFLLKRIQVALPDGCYGRIAPRSGLAYKKGIDVGAGVVDQDYRGNVGVILFNFGEEEFKVDSPLFSIFDLFVGRKRRPNRSVHFGAYLDASPC